MSILGPPSDDLPEVLATGRGDTTTVVVSMTGRHPEGLDAEYLEWHALDHRPEQHRLDGLRGSLRVVSTPACREARAASEAPYDEVDHVMAYLFAHADLGPWRAMGSALNRAGRMPIRLPSIEVAPWAVTERVAAPRVLAGADVIPWRPATGAYLLVEDGARPAGALAEVDGVAGVWSATGDGGRQLAWCFLDDDPVAVAERLVPALEARWAGDVQPLLAAPFMTVVPYDWSRSLP